MTRVGNGQTEVAPTASDPLLVSRESLTDRVVDALVALIEARGLREGDNIPPSAELADIFGVSRTVVREALAELAGRGLLLRRQGREGVFTLPGGPQLAELLGRRLAHKHVTHAELQEFREVVELAAARLAAERATNDDIAELQQRLDALHAAEAENDLHEADVAFHRAVATASHNSMFVLVLDGLAPVLRDARSAAWRGWIKAGRDREGALAHHGDIVAQIAAHDEGGAAEAMARDLNDARTGLMEADAPKRRPRRRPRRSEK